MAAPLILARTFRDAHAYAQGKLGLSIGHYRVVNSPGTLKAVRGTEIHLVEGWDKRPDRFSMKSAMRYCHNRIVDTTAEAPRVIHFVSDGGMLHAVADVSDAVGVDTPEDVTCPTCTEILEREGLPKIEITVVPDDTPTPQHHLDMIERVAPHLAEPTVEEAEAATLEATAQVTQDDEPTEEDWKAELESMLEPEGWEPPASLTAEQVLRLAAGESGAEVAPMSERTPTVVAPEAEALAAEKPKARRRSRCKDCGNLHYKDEPCPTGGE